jgi:hypothetical protein
MTHWDFFENKLGKDVVKYIIQPMLMPSEAKVSEKQQEVIDLISQGWFNTWSGNRVRIVWKPSWIVARKKRYQKEKDSSLQMIAYAQEIIKRELREGKESPSRLFLLMEDFLKMKREENEHRGYQLEL